MRRSALVLALLIAPTVALAGCGEPRNTVWVTGKVLKGGTAYFPPKGQFLNVTFVGMEIQDRSGKTIPSDDQFWAEVDQEKGTFSVPGTDGQGIPPGKYRVAVTQKMRREAFEAAKPSAKSPKGVSSKSSNRKIVTREDDMLADKFGMGTSPIIREVKAAGEQVIDLDKPAD